MIETAIAILSVFGCIAFFIFGMKLLTDGVEQISGMRMRRFLNQIAKNRVSATLAGFSLTALLQSSSAISVLVLSFVNAGMISIRKAFAVIIGANIGTTVTLWLLVLGAIGLNLFNLGLVLFCISVPIFLIKNKFFKQLGLAMIGFSIIFISLKILKEIIPVDLGTIHFQDYFGINQDHSEYVALLIAVFVSFLITLVFQSSSAATALILTLLIQGIVSFDIALAFILGANIGTTITALIASSVGNTYARAVAKFHLFFNVVGVIWCFPFLPLISEWILSGTSNVFNLLEVDKTIITEKAIGLAFFHTGFNFLNAILFLLILPFVVRLFLHQIILRRNKSDEKTVLQGELSMNHEIYIYEANQITRKFAGNIVQTISSLGALITESDAELFQNICDDILILERQGDALEEEVHRFLSSIDSRDLEKSLFTRQKVLIRVCHHLESIGDLAIKTAVIQKERRQSGSYITPKMRVFLMKMQKQLDLITTELIQNLDEIPNKESVALFTEIEQEINAIYQDGQKQMFKVMEKDKLPTKSIVYYNELLRNYELIGDHLYKANRILSHEK